MKTLCVAPALVAVLLVAEVPLFVLSQRAEASGLALPVMILAKLIDREITRPHPTSDEALNLAGHVTFNGQEIAASLNVQESAAVIAKIEGNQIVYLVDPSLVMRPHLDKGITRVVVHGNTIDTISWGIDRARECGRRTTGRYVPLSERDSQTERWLIPIEINSLELGVHVINVDVFFRNGRKDSSLRGFVYLCVTSYDQIQQGLNSPVIQSFLRGLSGVWSPVPALGTESFPVNGEMARELGMDQMAQTSGVPPDGTVVTERELGQAITAPQPAPMATDYLAQICREVGYDGDAACAAPVFRTSLTDDVPVVVCLRSPGQQVTVNGSVISPVCSGFVVVRAAPRQALTIDVSGVRIYSGVVPPQGFGLWLNAQ